jgi:hypothetical protein
MGKLTRAAVVLGLSRLDGILGSVGFGRRPKRNVYARELAQAHQEIEVAVHMNPKYGAGAEAHIYPMLRVGFPSVSRLAVAMLGSAKLLADSADVVIAQPLDSVAPRESRVRWFASGEEELDAILGQVAEFMVQWGVPFLDEYSSIHAYLDGYARGDQRLILQQHSFVFVAAAYLEAGERDKARQVLGRHLSSTGLRRRFEAAFNYLESHPE